MILSQESKSTETSESFEALHETPTVINESLESKELLESVSRATNVVGMNVEVTQAALISPEGSEMYQKASKLLEVSTPDSIAIKNSKLAGVKISLQFYSS